MMGLNVPKNPRGPKGDRGSRYKIMGVIEFISIPKQEKYGYQEIRFDYPVFYYTAGKKRETGTALYVKNRDDDDFELLPRFMVEQFYAISEAQEKFPELFL